MKNKYLLSFVLSDARSFTCRIQCDNCAIRCNSDAFPAEGNNGPQTSLNFIMRTWAASFLDGVRVVNMNHVLSSSFTRFRFNCIYILHPSLYHRLFSFLIFLWKPFNWGHWCHIFNFNLIFILKFQNNSQKYFWLFFNYKKKNSQCTTTKNK